MKVIQVDIMHNEDVVKEPNNSLLIDARGNKNCFFDLKTIDFMGINGYFPINLGKLLYLAF